MDRRLLIIAFCFIFILAADISYAAGIIYRVQEMKAMKQKEYEEYQQSQQSQQQGSQPQEQQANTQQTYQQTVDDRNQAIAQAILAAHSPSLSNETIDQAQEQTSSPGALQQDQAAVPASSSNVQDVVDLTEVWKKLDTKSTVWPLLIDDQAKVLTVSEYIGRFQKQGVKINEPPSHYVQMIDQIVGANPQMLQRPFGELVQIVAIVDYDFGNGMDKDTLARKVLGEAAFEANKKRFSQ